MITTHPVFRKWERMFKDPMITLAIFDRIIHQCVILDTVHIEGYCAQQANRQYVPETVS
jgi:DNA replication protein DnaC